VLTSWVWRRTLQEFGFYRSRWTCTVPAIVIDERHGVRVSRETVRGWLGQHGLV
jgi:hypothetical protein